MGQSVESSDSFDVAVGDMSFSVGKPAFVAQPKLYYAKVVEEHDLHVPRRFATLGDALAANVSFLARSEHPDDLMGPSGIVESLFVRPADIAWAKEHNTSFFISWDQLMESEDPYAPIALRNQLFAHMHSLPQDLFERIITHFSEGEIEAYCSAANIDSTAYKKDVSYSYWEGLPGINWAIAADSAVKDRYHVFAKDFSPSNGFMNLKNVPTYRMIQDGEIIAEDTTEDGILGGNIDHIRSVIAFYDRVRNLPELNPNECPIMEIQQPDADDGSRLSFLQIHNLNEFQDPSISLDGVRIDDGIEVQYARGSTLAEGVDVMLSARPRYGSPKPEIYTGALPNKSIGALEARIREVPLQIIPLRRQQSLFLPDSSHTRYSLLLKPGVSVVLFRADIDKILDGAETGSDDVRHLNLNVVADGYRGIVRVNQSMVN